MKRMFTFITALAFGLTAFAAEISKPAPDFTGTDINGKTVHLSDYKGKIVVLESYNPECPFCQHHYDTGAMQELQRQFTSKGVIWLVVDSVNKDNDGYLAPAAAQKQWTAKKFAATAWLDDSSGVIGHLYDMKTTPHMFVIAANGTLVYQGALDNNPTPSGDPHAAKNYVESALNNLIAGQPVTLAQTKPYGCSVHYAE
jgi:peroxiredoxin